jgi:hypothetical protein
VNPRRLRLMDECWPVLSSGFDEALKAFEPTGAGTGRGTHETTAPGRLVTTLSTISGGSDRELGGQDTNLSVKIRSDPLDIDKLVHFCREQKNASPAVVGPLERLVESENGKLIDGLYAHTEPVKPSNPTLSGFLEKVADLVPARPLVFLVKGPDDLAPGERDGHQVRNKVHLHGQDRALAYTNARHLIVRQTIEPVTLDWELTDGNDVVLLLSSRSVLRRQAGHKVFVWT